MRMPVLVAAAATLSLVAGAAHGQTVTPLVKGSHFHGVHGIRFSPKGELYAGSVAGQTLYAVNVETGAVRTVEGPPHGMADDIAFGPGDQVVWTAISEGVVYTRRGKGPVEVLAKDMPGANSVAFSRDGKRLFLGQVFAGDGVWELDPMGARPPRKIAGPVGGFNSFSPGPDGALYGPLWFKGQIARIDPDTGQVSVVAEGFETLAAAKFDSKDNLWVIDTKQGVLYRVDIKTGTKTKAAQLSTSLDNIAVGPGDRIFVSNMADNGVQEVDVKTGAVRQVVKGALAFPADIDVRSFAGRDTLYVADVFAYRRVDATNGAVTDVARMHSDELEYPTGISIAGNHVILSSSVAGTVEVFDRVSGKRLSHADGFPGVTDALELPGGALLVAQVGGDVVQAEGSARKTVVQGLKAPTSLARAANGTIYVIESGAGRLSRLDLTNGAATQVADGFTRPKAVAVGPNGRPVVLDMGERTVVEVVPSTGGKTVIARDLPVGLLGGPVPLGAGLAIGARGDIYLASDVENAIYRIRR
jgi:sugar lactone lactonase YvrE